MSDLLNDSFFLVMEVIGENSLSFTLRHKAKTQKEAENWLLDHIAGDLVQMRGLSEGHFLIMENVSILNIPEFRFQSTVKAPSPSSLAPKTMHEKIIRRNSVAAIEEALSQLPNRSSDPPTPLGEILRRAEDPAN